MIEQLYKKRKQGSSLMFIIVAVAFVGILASIILNLTMINLETKSTERVVKKSFYSAEEIMDKVNITLEEISEEAMQKAYVDLLSNYTTNAMTSTDQNVLQNQFAKNYIENILLKIASSASAITTDYKGLTSTAYSVKKIQDKMNDVFVDTDANLGDCFITEQKDATMSLVFDPTDYNSEKCLILKNVKVKHSTGKDPSNKDKDAETSTWITTDIKMIVPILSYEGGNTYPEFTKYSIIGDEKVESKFMNANEVNGNVYAGVEGLYVTGGNLTIKGSSAKLVTRGEVVAQQTGTINLGEVDNLLQVWAQGYRTEIRKDGGGAAATLNVRAESYIYDDLSLDSPYSRACFDAGEYYGYMFNKDNAEDTSGNVNSMYSSAIVINGRHSSLYMGDKMSKILLGGRAFVSKPKDPTNEVDKIKKDIMTGQSVSVKPDQYAILVPENHLSEGFANPMPLAKYKELDDQKKTPMSKAQARVLSKYVKVSDPVETIIYDLTTNSTNAGMVYFYYNFKSQAAANLFYQKECDKTEMTKRIVDGEYLHFSADAKANGVTIGGNALSVLTMANVSTFTSEATGIQTKNDTIIKDEKTEQHYKNLSIQRASKYKAYQLSLTEQDWKQYGSDFNIEDKTESPIFDVLMTKNDKDITTFVAEAGLDQYGFKTLPGETTVKVKSVPVKLNSGMNVYAVFVAQTDLASVTGDESALSLSTVLSEGGVPLDGVAIVVSNCNIKVDRSLRGLVISDNTVSFGANNIKLQAESALLQEMFSKQKSIESSKGNAERFLHYFVDFAKYANNASGGNADDIVDISTYIQYVNWKKNNE